MCGIAGFVGPPDPELIGAMSARLVHRGPDDHGVLERPFASISHRRLSVIDPEHGHQPMSNPEGTLHIVYNGEVHNFRELRAELESEGFTFATWCDTEVVLRAYEAWGASAVRRFNGMWAFVVLDERGDEPAVFFSRDNFGVKPLYLATVGGRLLFASEIKALLACPELAAEPDEERLALYLLRGLHNHDEGTFFAGVTQLPPATNVVVTPRDGKLLWERERYWTPKLSSDGPDDPAVLRAALERAVERRLIADVTVGTCLSGGLDSSTIVSLMNKLLRAGAPDAASMGEKLKTFSAVFDGDPIDEQRYIGPVLETTDAESHFIRPRSGQLFKDLPLVVWHQDEPMVSSGPYAQFQVMSFAKDYAQVLLDGQGGDELLAGYVPHQLVYIRQLVAERKWREAAHEAAAARDVLGPLMRQRLVDRRKRVDPAGFCRPAVTAWAAAAREADTRTQRDLKTRLLQDLTVYSLPPMLRYEDRNAMAHSIESRPPFLDQDLVELVLSLPASAIVRDGWARWILREAMRDSLPDVVRKRRKKIGFTTPEMRWLRAERATVQGVFRSPAFTARPYWDGPAVARAFAASCAGKLEESSFFWRVLNTEAWLRVFHGPLPLSPAGARPEASLQRAADAEVPRLVGAGHADQAALLLDTATPNPGRHLFASGPYGRSVWARVPVRIGSFGQASEFGSALGEALESSFGTKLALQDGDVIVISCDFVGIARNRRSRSAASVARDALDRLPGRTPAVSPTMEIAADTARRLSEALSSSDGNRVEVVIVDADDLGASVLGSSVPTETSDGAAGAAVGSAGRDAGLVDRVEWLVADDPLGPGGDTPVALLRRVGTLR